MNPHASCIPYPPIEKHGVIGDRRTAALIAADGTLDWLCLPHYDSPPVFGGLLDVQRGGWWRLGPSIPALGRQSYGRDTALLTTTWTSGRAELELLDVMVAPEDERPATDAHRRAVVRRLRATRGRTECRFDIQPRYDMRHAASLTRVHDGIRLQLDHLALHLWVTCPVTIEASRAFADISLREEEEVWAVLTLGEAPWAVARAREAVTKTAGYWREWLAKLSYTGPRADGVRRSAMSVHLLGYSPAGSLVAAPTTSLPERIGGDGNYDYRYAWIRDASLSLAVLALLGDTKAAKRYMDWIASLGSSTDAPLQVVYGIDGRTELPQQERTDLYGYSGSKPVRLGNHAYQQQQLDSLGYFADCALIYLQQGGEWRDEYWDLVRRAADYTTAHWQKPDSGIWELSTQQHYVSSKIMSWVVLDRAVKTAESTNHPEAAGPWRATMASIHHEVMTTGWSDTLSAFRQRYEAESLDASVLLIAVMGLLPADHPRVIATADRIAQLLTVEGFVHRFDPGKMAGMPDLPLREFEGASLPCTFWLATTYAMAGQPDKAEDILRRAERVEGPLGLFAEEVDGRTQSFRGNTPLLFSQVEYVRAIMELAKTRPLDHARLMVGQAQQQVRVITKQVRRRGFPLALAAFIAVVLGTIALLSRSRTGAQKVE